MDARPNSRRPLVAWICLAAVGVAVVAVTVFGLPLRSLLVYGLFAACPLMHLFMGHGAHARDGNETVPAGGRSASAAPDKP